MEGLQQFAKGIAEESPIHRLDPRTKIALLTVFSLLVVLFEAAEPLLLLLGMVLIAHFIAGASSSRLRMLLLIILLSAWGTIFSQALFYAARPRTILLTIVPEGFPVLGSLTGGIRLYREGFQYGLVQSLRLSSMLSLGLLVSWTTQPGTLLLGLSRLGMPYGLSFMAATAFRFLPVTLSEASTVLTAERLRGARLFHRGGWVNVRLFLRILRPIFANAIQRSTTLAHSILVRGFDPREERTRLKELRLRSSDRVVLGLLFFGLGFVAGAKILFWLWAEGLFYASWLRPLYAFTRRYL